jgi:hypothetical protein
MEETKSVFFVFSYIRICYKDAVAGDESYGLLSGQYKRLEKRMETKTCIYCGRNLGLNELIEKAGKYRCQNENDCLEYQIGQDPDGSIDNADYVSEMIQSSLSEAARRIDGYQQTRADRSQKNEVESSEESKAEFAWMKTVLDGLAFEYKEKGRFVFQYDDSPKNEYEISFNDTANDTHFTVKIENLSGSRYSLAVAKEDRIADKDSLYGEFIFKTYPISQREDVIRDLTVILKIFEGETDLLSALLNEFRMEIESRPYLGDSGSF